MNAETQTNTLSRAFGWIIAAVALAMAAVGFLNSMPSFWIIPAIGPFPSTILRPLILMGSVLIVVLRAPITATIITRRPDLKWLGVAIDTAIVIAAAWVFWRYYVDVSAIEVGLFAFTWLHAAAALTGAAIFTVLCWRVWGAPLAICGIVALVYLYTGQYWPWIFETAPTTVIASAEDLWFNQNDGILGNIMGILIFTVFPFVLLGTMLEQTGGGHSMIRVAYHLTKNFRGGPAHTAIVASGLFGTMSGSTVTNVVATGVITIPMIKRRGFHPAFAGGIEASASSAGQIMPPIMGAAALVMADLTGISYLNIIVAALVPALAYYASLFVAVVLEARRLGVEAAPEVPEDLALVTQDIVNLVMIVVPLAVVVGALLQGFSPAGSGIMAFLTLIPLSFANPAVRRDPLMVLRAFAYGGEIFGQLLMAIGVVGIIVAVLGATGLPTDFAQLVGRATGTELFSTLLIAALSALMLGMGMPTLPAYLTIVLILGPSMQTLGLAVLTAHLFVFYYGVASSITPPVAVAAYAAASISGAPPLMTAMYAMRIGLVKFLVPFVFAYYPVLLMVEEGGAVFEPAAFISIVVRLLLVIYLVSSVVIAFDYRRLPAWEIAVRVALAGAVLMIDPLIHWPMTVLALAFLVWHYVQFRGRLQTAVAG